MSFSSVLSPSFSLSPMLSSSRLLSNVQALAELSGSFYFYEPTTLLRSGEPGFPLVWGNISPNEADTLSWSDLDAYSLTLCSSLSGTLGLSPEEAIARICAEKRWQQMTLLWTPDYCQSGDYGGAVHCLSNAKELLSSFSSPECRELYGGHGSHGVAIDPRYLSEDLLESLQSLESYPILNEDALSALEMELQGEAWDNWAAQDFSRSLEKALSSLLSQYYDDMASEERAEKSIESLSEDQLFNLFSRAMEDGNIYWENQYNDTYVDVEKVVESLSEDQLLSLLLPE